MSNLEDIQNVFELLDRAFANEELIYKTDEQINESIKKISNLELDIKDKIKAINGVKLNYDLKEVKKYLKANDVNLTPRVLDYVKLYLKYEINTE